MKKIVCFLLLFQGGMMMAQTETVATINGKKIQVVPNGVGTADNGITAANNNVQLGGLLVKPTTLITTSTETLSLLGLQDGVAADKILVVDAGGVIKSVANTSNIKEIKKIAADYTVADTDFTLLASQLTGDITITLPAASTNKGRMLVINQLNVANDSGAEVTVKFNTDVVYTDKLSAKELTAGFNSVSGTLKVILQSDGTNWNVVSSL
ncbi:hypothetical protein [Flavobacterium gelatinilyticum]|uniref:hypothetical protein n=1 Tax=Flavobacterium gelatinilyticum TaxID=3003260 RepID=UPI00248121EA|nr:hypothetical protein [Flavobacterium gelatinilyticum]